MRVHRTRGDPLLCVERTPLRWDRFSSLWYGFTPEQKHNSVSLAIKHRRMCYWRQWDVKPHLRDAKQHILCLIVDHPLPPATRVLNSVLLCQQIWITTKQDFFLLKEGVLLYWFICTMYIESPQIHLNKLSGF